MLGGFKERFDIENPKIIRLLQRLLIKINQNDHFEFHRLKALNQIQLAKSLRGVEYTDEDIEQMEESYKEFEKELVKIEDDRKFRLEAIKWLDTVENFEAFEVSQGVDFENISPEGLDRLIDYIVELFGNRFTRDDVYDGLASKELIPVINKCINEVTGQLSAATRGEGKNP